MKKRIENLIIPMSDAIEKTISEFLNENLEDEEELTDTLNLILSAGLSSTFNLLTCSCQGSKEPLILVNELRNKIFGILSNQELIIEIAKI